MTRLHDLLLAPPLGDGVLQVLLFVTFVMHFLFVLLLLGTAILAVVFELRDALLRRSEDDISTRRIARSFLVHKSVAVVLGVAPLLLIQVGFTVPFFSAVVLFAPWWLSLVLLMIVAFLAFDFPEHMEGVRRGAKLALWTVSLAVLLVIPGVFVLILTTAEHAGAWPEILRLGIQLPPELGLHWVLRYLHVLGAAIVFGAAFHAIRTPAQEARQKAVLVRWAYGGLLAQIVIGVLLYAWLPRDPEAAANVAVALGVTAAVALLGYTFLRRAAGGFPRPRTVITLLALLLVSMLAGRQFLQNQGFLPLLGDLREARQERLDALAPHRAEALAAYGDDLAMVHDTGQRIYKRACAFCHNVVGRGDGPAAADLEIPPEAVGFARMSPAYLQKVLHEGIPGTGMPYFSYYDEAKRRRLLEYMDRTMHIFGPVPAGEPVAPEVQAQAEEVWMQTCSSCHGTDGRGAELSRRYEPPPPDFTQFVPLPDRAEEVIAGGYRGTMMFAYEDLAPDVRHALARKVVAFREGEVAPEGDVAPAQRRDRVR